MSQLKPEQQRALKQRIHDNPVFAQQFTDFRESGDLDRTAKHRENIQAEMDRHMTAVRRQKAEYAEKCDSILRRMNEIKMQRAASRAEEEKAAAAIGCPIANPADNSGCPTEELS